MVTLVVLVETVMVMVFISGGAEVMVWKRSGVGDNRYDLKPLQLHLTSQAGEEHIDTTINKCSLVHKYMYPGT